MTFLLGLWFVSLALVVAALLTMAGLVLRRMWLGRRERLRQIRRDQLLSQVLEILSGGVPLSILAGDLRPADRRLLRELIFELLRSIRGDDHAHLVEMLLTLRLVDDELSALTQGRHRERVAAARRLAVVAKPEIDSALISALDDPDAEVRLAAATTLVERGTPVEPRMLTRKLGIGGGERSRLLRTIFRKLARIAPDRVAELLTDEGPDLVKVLALDALGAAGDYQTLPNLIAAAQHASINVRANALRALGLLGHPEAVPAVSQGLIDPAWPVRTQAAIAAGRLGAQEAIPVLTTLLDDPQWWARYRAAQALRRLGPAGLRVLEDASRTRSRAGRVAQMLLEERAA